MKPNAIIKTARIVLRPWTYGDTDNVSKYLNDKDVMRYLGGVATRDDIDGLVRWLIDDQQDWHGITFWCMEKDEDKEFLGFCGLVKVDEEDSTVLDSVELGYRLRKDAWDQGYAKEATIASLYYAFDELRAHRVVSRTTIENWQSWGLMKRLGFSHDTRLDYNSADGEALIVHVMTKAMWDKAKKELPNTAIA